MPNSNTFSIKPIKELIEKYAIGKIVDPFANSNKLATVTNDLDTQYDTDYHMDALDFLKIFDDNSVDTVLYILATTGKRMLQKSWTDSKYADNTSFILV